MKISNAIVEQIALRLGFTLVGFTSAELLQKETAFYRKWLNNGYGAEMEYMNRNIDKRANVKLVYHEARSVVSLGINYYVPLNHVDNEREGKISRYAWGKDYHLVLWNKLGELIKELKTIDAKFIGMSYVDTGPVMDKVWAVRSGLGWMGKHTNVINPAKGSWFFIAAIITNYEFDQSNVVADHCGTCTACLDACPTSAFPSPYVLDARKCISYQTIENMSDIPELLSGKFNGWIFGCDICQDVCPWNKKFSFETGENEFFPADGKIAIALSEVEAMTEKSFKEQFAESPIKRAKLKGLKRNAKFLKKNI